MHASLRPYATAGVALVGASVIAVTPIAPPPPDIQVANPAIQLTAESSPIAALTALLDNTLDNTGVLADRFLENPAPIAEAVLEVQLSYAAALANATGLTVENYLDLIVALPDTAVEVLDLLAEGEIEEALLLVQDTGQAFLDAGLPLVTAPLAIVNNTDQNVANVVEVLTSQAVPVGLALLAPGIAVGRANADIAQGLFDELTELDLVTAAAILGAAPFAATDAFLNGFDDTPGLLSEDGTIATLLDLRDDVADGIDPLPDPSPLTSNSVAESTIESAQRFDLPIAGPAEDQGGAAAATVETPVAEAEDDGAADAKEDTKELDTVDLVGKTENGGTDLSDGNSASSPGKKGATANRPGKRVQEAVQGAGTNIRNTVNDFGDRVLSSLPGGDADADADSGEGGGGSAEGGEGSE